MSVRSQEDLLFLTHILYLQGARGFQGVHGPPGLNGEQVDMHTHTTHTHAPNHRARERLASFPGRIGEIAWQLPRVQTVYGCYVTVIAIFHYNRLVQVILTNFPAVRMGLSCSWKQLFAVRSTTEVK